MLKYLFCLFFFFISQSFSALLTEKHLPSPEFSRLLEVLEVSPSIPIPALVIGLGQKCLQEGERWEFQERLESKRDEILPTLDQLGFFRTVYPVKRHYTYGVVLGALYESVKRRIHFLIEEWNKGVRFEQIVFLSGQRLLHSTKEPLPFKTETEMMKFAWDEAPVPDDLRQLPLVITDAGAREGRSRPDTLDTIFAWLESNPDPGSCLFFSTQPYVEYQEAILKELLPKAFSIECIGLSGGKNQSMADLLDNVTKVLIWEAYSSN